MADNTTNFDIRFKTTADLAAAKLTENAVKGVKQANEGLDQSQGKVAGSSRNMGNALLQGSRALQDSQYGFAGVVNNLEGIASAMGLGAGVAGVVTVLAVAMQSAAPHIEAFFASLDKSKIATDALKALQDQLTGTVQVKTFAEKSAEDLAKAIQAESDVIEAESTAIERNLKLLEKRTEIESQAAKSKLDSDIEDIKAQGLPPEQEAQAIAAKKKEALDEQFVRDQAAQDARLKAADDEVMNQAKGVEQASAARAKAEADFKRVIDYDTVNSQIAQAQKEADDAKATQQATLMQESPNPEDLQRAEQQQKDAEEKVKTLQAQAAQIFTSGPMADKGTAQAALAARQKEEQERAAALKKANEERLAMQQMEQLDAQGRLNTYNAQNVKIARGANPGVYDPANLQGGAEAGSVNPLTGSVEGLGSPLGSGTARPLPAPVQPANGANLAGPLQQAANALEGNPLASLVSELGKPLQSAASSMEAMAKSAQNAVNQAKTFDQRIKTLEAQQKNR